MKKQSVPILPWPEMPKVDPHQHVVSNDPPKQVVENNKETKTDPKKHPDRATVHEAHIAMVKETLKCEDEVIPGSNIFQTCAHKAMLGECKTEYMIFGCPKSCGYCENDRLCVDYFLKKCPDYKKERGCNDPWMTKHCMKTCEQCNPPIESPKTEPEAAVELAPIVPMSEIAAITGPLVVHGIAMQPKIDPTKLHTRWLAGEIPEPVSNVPDLILI